MLLLYIDEALVAMAVWRRREEGDVQLEDSRADWSARPSRQPELLVDFTPGGPSTWLNRVYSKKILWQLLLLNQIH